MNAQENKRKNKRHHCYVPVEGKRGEPFAGSQTIDISSDGAGLLINSFVQVKSEMPVELDVAPSSDPILTMGEVRWIKRIPNSEQYRVGLYFKDLKQNIKSRINRVFQ